MRFFVPYLKDDPEAAEVQWQAWLVASSAPAASRRIYSMEYEHESSRFEVTVGKARKEYKRRTGPRGGYIKNADYNRLGAETGTEVSGIVDAGGLIYVWSYGPPFGGWPDPSLVDEGEVRRVDYFDYEEPG